MILSILTTLIYQLPYAILILKVTQSNLRNNTDRIIGDSMGIINNGLKSSEILDRIMGKVKSIIGSDLRDGYIAI